jgi:RNA polymerase sigma-70 factor (ECF subfamily)
MQGEGRQPADASSAHAVLYGEQRARLIAMCTRMLGDAWAAEDAVHESFARLAACAGRLQGDPTAYLFTIARNVCRDELRRRRRRPETACDVDPASVADVESRALDRRTLAELWPRLSAGEQQLFTESAAGLPLAEMARRHGSSVAALAQRVHRARMRMRELASLPAFFPTDVVRALAARFARPAAARATSLLDGARHAERLGGPVAASVLAAVLTSGAAVPPATAAAPPDRPALATRPPSSASLYAGAHLPAPHLRALAVAAPGPAVATRVSPPPAPAPPVSMPLPPGENVTSISVSPDYQHHPTIFASGTPQPGCAGCTPLYRSDDGGATWRPLPARNLTGTAGGVVLLPSHFPADPEIFFFQPYQGLTWSVDGGQTFGIGVPVASGMAAIDPTLPGSSQVYVLDRTTGSLVVYDASSNTTHAPPLLAPDVNRVNAVFSAPHADGVYVSASGPLTGAALFACAGTSCHRAGPAPATIPVLSDTFAADHTFFSAASGAVSLAQPDGSGTTIGLDKAWNVTALLPAHNYASSRVLDVVATITATGQVLLLRSIHGGPFAPHPLGLDAASMSLSLMTRLPDGRLLAPHVTGGLSCSADDGRTWSSTC